MRACKACDLPCPPNYRWDGLCVPCWKTARGYELGAADGAYQAMAKEYAKFKAPRPAAGDAPPLTQGQIQTLIALCHPDKHGGSDRANEITAVLLALRIV